MYFHIIIEKGNEVYNDYIEKANDKDEVINLVNSSLIMDGDSPDDFIILADELTIQECINKEYLEVKKNIIRNYISNHYAEIMPYRELYKLEQDISKSDEEYYRALKDFNKIQRLDRWIKRLKASNNLTLQKYHEIIYKLSNATSEENFNQILSTIK